jgi:hypothetical protein
LDSNFANIEKRLEGVEGMDGENSKGKGLGGTKGLLRDINLMKLEIREIGGMKDAMAGLKESGHLAALTNSMKETEAPTAPSAGGAKSQDSEGLAHA